VNSERKLRIDLLANLASFVVLGISGIAINLLIGRYYTPDTLGVFNQVFAFYILGAQFGAFGIHFSTLHYVARLQDRLEQRRCITTAIPSNDRSCRSSKISTQCSRSIQWERSLH